MVRYFWAGLLVAVAVGAAVPGCGKSEPPKAADRQAEEERTARQVTQAEAASLKAAAEALEVKRKEATEAKTAYETALRSQDAEKLARYGGAKWTQIQDAVRAAQGAGDDFEKAEKEYKRARDLLPDAARAAEQGYRAALLATAKANDSPERGRAALAALNKLLKLEPDNEEANALKEKIAEYYVPKPGDVLTNGIGMKLVFIPPGEFMMGSPAGESDEVDERPRHRVRITQGFFMGTTEVTVGQFAEFVEATGYRTDAEKGDGADGRAGKTWETRKDLTWRNPGFAQTDSHPVVGVSWNDAEAFCEWLSGQEESRYRLPTEAEWEYSCRAGSKGLYAGNGSVDDIAWHRWNCEWKIQPVGTKQANAWGLYDMHGNVWEWCADWYGKGYYRQSPTDDPKGPDGPGDNGRRVVRGGSWRALPKIGRSAFRARSRPEHRNDDCGFRVCLDLD